MTLTISARPYSGETDLAPIVEFLNLCEAHDKIEEGISVEELRIEFAEPRFDPARDLRLWFDDSGSLVGFGQLYAGEDSAENDGFLWFKVHPELRDGQIEPELFAWAEARLRELGRVRLTATAHEREPDRLALLERAGFRVVRYYLRMARALDELIPAPEFPQGYTLRAGDHDPQAWAELYNESFIDHYNFHAHDAEQVSHWQGEPDYRSDLNLVAVAPDGTLAAFAWSSISPQENERSGRKDGWIGVLGTRRGHRRIGLGRAMLLAAMTRLQEVGMEFARLGVDASSPTGATHLYESVGFRAVYRRALLSRDVPNVDAIQSEEP